MSDIGNTKFEINEQGTKRRKQESSECDIDSMIISDAFGVLEETPNQIL